MELRIVAAFAIPVVLMVILLSCKKESDQAVVSDVAGQSHKAGQNCISCHRSGGSGKGVFSLAGTVYNEAKTGILASASVKLYTGPNGTGTLKCTAVSDASGNFFITDAIDYGSGLYTCVQGSTSTQFMSSAVSDGQCNSCHGGTTAKIWTK